MLLRKLTVFILFSFLVLNVNAQVTEKVYDFDILATTSEEDVTARAKCSSNFNLVVSEVRNLEIGNTLESSLSTLTFQCNTAVPVVLGQIGQTGKFLAILNCENPGTCEKDFYYAHFYIREPARESVVDDTNSITLIPLLLVIVYLINKRN